MHRKNSEKGKAAQRRVLMTQRQYSTRQRKSDFPIFEYLDMMMPTRLIARFQEIPPHYRWLILSILASATLLWIFLKVVVGGLYAYRDAQIPRGFDALYLSYNIEERSLPVLPEASDENAAFVVLPQTIGDHYVLQIPPTEDEIQAALVAEREIFLTLSVPAEDALTAFQSSLMPASDTTAAPDANSESASEVAAAQPTESSEVNLTTDPAAGPTVDPVQLQTIATNVALPELAALNDALADAESLQPVYDRMTQLQSALNGLTAAGVTLPELDALNARLTEIASQEAPAQYQVNDCLVSSQIVVRRDEAFVIPCPIGNTAIFVEQGTYLYDNTTFNVAVAQYPEHKIATQAVRDIFNYARTLGNTGNFSFGPIAYDYVYSFADDHNTLTWSHEDWVYSISAENADALDSFMKVFPY